MKRNELRERCRKLNDRYNIELNRLSNICQPFENISAPNDKTLKAVKGDFQRQFKEVTELFEAFSEMKDSGELEELDSNVFTKIFNKFDVIFYQASNSLTCQSECDGGDAVDAKRVLTHMEKMKFPKFSGNCRDWPQFKKDFEKQVSSVIVDESTVSYQRNVDTVR